MSTSLIKPSTCPKCGHNLDAATPMDADVIATPSVGDISVCYKCAALLEFGPGLILHDLDVSTVDSAIQQQLAHAVTFIRLNQPMV